MELKWYLPGLKYGTEETATAVEITPPPDGVLTAVEMNFLHGLHHRGLTRVEIRFRAEEPLNWQQATYLQDNEVFREAARNRPNRQVTLLDSLAHALEEAQEQGYNVRNLTRVKFHTQDTPSWEEGVARTQAHARAVAGKRLGLLATLLKL